MRRAWSWFGDLKPARQGLVVTGILVVLIAVISLASTSGGGSKSSSPPASPPPPPAVTTNATAPPPPPAKKSNELTAAERRWFNDAEQGSQEITDALNDIAKKSADPAALLTDQNVRLQYAVDLGVLQACATLLGLDKAPTPRIRALTSPVRRACRHFRRSASLTARGIDNLDPALIRRGTREMVRGTSDINRATRRFLAFSVTHSG